MPELRRRGPPHAKAQAARDPAKRQRTRVTRMSPSAQSSAGTVAAAASRHERLRTGLQAIADSLRRRRASEIAEADIDAFVALDWLEWHGGDLRLTLTGRNVCAQSSAVHDRSPD